MASNRARPWAVLGACTLSLGLHATTAAADELAELSVPTQSADDQFDVDVTPIPAGMGALFVPALTAPDFEPSVVVLHRGERIATGNTAERIVVPPGEYTVIAGQGPEDERPRAIVKVTRGETARVPAFFGALRVSIVDAEGAPLADTYVIASLAKRRTWGPVAASDGTPGSRTPTWLLEPGNYVIALGSDPAAKTGSVVVRVQPGEATRYRLVVEDDRLVRTEFGESVVVKKASVWTASWIVGGSGAIAERTAQLTGLNGSYVFASLFTRTEAGISTKRHEAKLRLNVDQSFVALDSDYGRTVPLRPLTNEVEAELVYAYRLGGILGPYARAIGRTSLLATNLRPDVDLTYTTRDGNGAVVDAGTLAAGSRERLLAPIAPLVFQQGAGIGGKIIDTRPVSLAVRAGGAARQAIYNGGRWVSSRQGNQLNLVRLDDNQRLGAELTAIGRVKLGHNVLFETRFDSFIATSHIADSEPIVPIFRWDNSVAFRATRAISAVYTFSLRRDELALSRLQTINGLSLRVQHELF